MADSASFAANTMIMIRTISAAAPARTGFGNLAITAAISEPLEVLRRVPEVLRLVCVFLLADVDFERPDALEPDLRLTFVAAFSLSMILIPLCCLYFRYYSLLWRHFQSFPLSFQNFYLLLFHGLSQSLQPLLHQKD